MVELPLLGRKGTLSISTSEPALVIAPQSATNQTFPSPYRRLPLRQHNLKFVRHLARLELRLQFYIQRYVRCALCHHP